jgi:hypothetical protein
MTELCLSLFLVVDVLTKKVSTLYIPRRPPNIINDSAVLFILHMYRKVVFDFEWIIMRSIFLTFKSGYCLRFYIELTQIIKQNIITAINDDILKIL